MIKKINIPSICLIFLLFMISTQNVLAVKANPNPVQYTQPDGSVITIQMQGDEFMHWATTADGYTLLSDQNKAYEYAKTEVDGKLGFSGIIAHDPATRSAQESIFLRKIEKGIFFSKSQISEMKRLLKDSKSPDATEVGGFPTTGVRSHLMILANFNNTSTTYTQTNFNNLMNQANYNGTGSFKDYYLEVSYGQLTVNTVVTIWVVLPNTHNYYGPQAKWGTFAYDAIVAADQQAAIDYSTFDNDGDGIVDGICIAHQGRGQEESGNTTDIWSHSWDLAQAGYTPAQRTFDGVKVLDYTTIPEKGNPSSMTTIGVMCHEFGHNLGAPDFYDADYSTGGSYDGTGNWDIMAGGSWNGSPSGSMPAHHNPWTKTLYTWLTPTVLTSQQNVLLQDVKSHPQVVRYNTSTPNEYFLCENRQLTGFNAHIPGHGMIIYHVDGDYISSHYMANDINNTAHQGLYPMSATSTTPSGIMTSGGSTINTGGCPWPGNSGKTTFTDATIPNSKSWSGASTNLPLINIAENTSTKEVSFCFIACSDPTDPMNFTANSAGASQINLGWSLNTANNPVMVAFNLTNTFGSPVNGTIYTAGNTLSGGGTVLYTGANTTFNHTGLTPNTTYYYKAWSVTAGTTYSPGITANATTTCPPFATLPFTEAFTSTTIPSCWSQFDHQSNDQIWQFGTITGYSPAPALTGNYAYLNSHPYGSGNLQNADLISPTLDLSTASDIVLQFSHFFKEKTGSSGTVSYSTDNGLTWTPYESFTVTTENPAYFNQAIPAIAGQSQVKIKWNFTGTNAYYWAIDDINITVPTLSVTPLNQDVPPTTGITTFDVTSNTTWTFTSDQTWCVPTALGVGNETIYVECYANPTSVQRVAHVTITVAGMTPVEVTVTQGGAVGLDEPEENTISIVPNPNHGVFTLTAGKFTGDILNVVLYDNKGAIIMSKKCQGSRSYTFDAGSMQRGEYVIRISIRDKSFVKKLVIE